MSIITPTTEKQTIYLLLHCVKFIMQNFQRTENLLESIFGGQDVFVFAYASRHELSTFIFHTYIYISHDYCRTENLNLVRTNQTPKYVNSIGMDDMIILCWFSVLCQWVWIFCLLAAVNAALSSSSRPDRQASEQQQQSKHQAVYWKIFMRKVKCNNFSWFSLFIQTKFIIMAVVGEIIIIN